jgi:hypothetical protein
MFLKSAVLTVLITLPLAAANAADTLRIFTGGPGVAKFLDSKKAELEKAVGAPIEVRSSPATASIKFLSKGIIQGLVMGNTPEQAFKDAEASDVAGDSPNNYEWFEFHKVYIKMGFNPENTVKDLTSEQIRDVLNGKIKSWKEIGGIDAPPAVFFIKASTGTIKEVKDHYLKGQAAKNAEFVLDRDGLVRALQRNKGGMIFTPTTDSVGDFKPRYVNSEMSHSTYYVVKKDAAPAAKKLYDVIKAMPRDDSY